MWKVKITDHDLREAIERMRGDLELNGKTRVPERIEHFTGIEPKALWTTRVFFGLALPCRTEDPSR